jgi:hypothetical protein
MPQVRKAALKMASLQGSARLEEECWPAGPSGSSGNASSLSGAALNAVRDYMLQVEWGSGQGRARQGRGRHGRAGQGRAALQECLLLCG